MAAKLEKFILASAPSGATRNSDFKKTSPETAYRNCLSLFEEGLGWLPGNDHVGDFSAMDIEIWAPRDTQGDFSFGPAIGLEKAIEISEAGRRFYAVVRQNDGYAMHVPTEGRFNSTLSAQGPTPNSSLVHLSIPTPGRIVGVRCAPKRSGLLSSRQAVALDAL